MYSLLIKNANLYDGDEINGESFDVACEGDQIVAIGKNLPKDALTTIDATGKALCPGFVDLQNHSDVYWQIFDNPDLDGMVSQGFTTAILGNCGASLAPLLSPDAILSIQKWHNLQGLNINWQSFAEFASVLQKRKFGCNIGSLTGYSTLRRGIVGDSIRGLEQDELNILKEKLKESLSAGSFGLSSGLSYSHEISISEIELYELAKIVKEYSGMFSIHLRNESEEIIEALEEALNIARTTEVNLKISHLKIRGKKNWHKFDEVVQKLETSHHRGINVSFDAYPYDTVWQVLYSYLPKWAIEGGRTLMLKHFSDPVQKNKILSYLNNSESDIPSLFVASTSSDFHFAGKTISMIAKNLECSSEQALLHILENGGTEIMVFDKNLNSEQVKNFIFHPLSIIASDGAGFSEKNSEKNKLVHPRCFGAVYKFFELVSESKFNLHTAIKKLTSAPAKKIGLKKRGQIKPGFFADLVIFEPQNMKDLSDYKNPYKTGKGIEYVFVNGEPAIFQGQRQTKLHGHFLTKKI